MKRGMQGMWEDIAGRNSISSNNWFQWISLVVRDRMLERK
jgi:hypothetical protein